MKTITIKLMLLFFVTAMLQLSCKKDDPAPPADNTKQLLQNKNWKMTGLTITPAYYGIIDWYSLMEDCNKDNIYRFNSPDIFQMDIGPLECFPGEPQNTGKWNYRESNKTLYITLDPAYPDTLRISQINENSFTTKSDFIETGITYTETAIFIKQ